MEFSDYKGTTLSPYPSPTNGGGEHFLVPVSPVRVGEKLMGFIWLLMAFSDHKFAECSPKPFSIRLLALFVLRQKSQGLTYPVRHARIPRQLLDRPIGFAVIIPQCQQGIKDVALDCRWARGCRICGSDPR